MIDDATLDALAANAKSAILEHEVPGKSLLTRRWAMMAVEARTVEALVEEVRSLRGAIASQDARERAAGEKCSVPYDEHGCDWPDAAAEKIVFLRAEIEDLKRVQAFNTSRNFAPGLREQGSRT